MTYRAIHDYGVIGDMHSAALVSSDGSIDWLCFPKFNSPSVFAAILDDSKGGRFHIRPAGDFKYDQHYVDDTNVLRTQFRTASGRGAVTDFMPVGKNGVIKSPHDLYRIVQCDEGTLDIELTFEPRLNYARTPTAVSVTEHAAVARNGTDVLALVGDVPLQAQEQGAEARFTLREGETACFALHWGTPSPPSIAESAPPKRLEETVHFWRDISQDWSYRGRWRDLVRRSMLAMHLLIYAPTGAVCAAATTSLPESIGGVRNWDYRCAWLRDAAFTVDVFNRLNHTTYTRPFIDWVAAVVDEDDPGHDIHAVYSISPDENGDWMREQTLDHFEGYKGSAPVRIGNDAYDQFQLDLFGEILLALDSYHRAGGHFDDMLWKLTEYLVEGAARRWQEPDSGIWEFRTEPRHFTYSRLMCWVALDRGLRLANALQRPIDFDRWRRTRDEIKAAVLERGWNPHKQSFTQYFGGESLDASLLFLPMVGFLPADDPRMHSTIAAIWNELGVDGLIRRYIPQEAEDGIPGEEGTFTMCSLWLAGSLISAGRLDEAEALFTKIVEMGNHVGLYSEMLSPDTGMYLGNYPQAFTHIALIHTARNLDRALEQRKTGRLVRA